MTSVADLPETVRPVVTAIIVIVSVVAAVWGHVKAANKVASAQTVNTETADSISRSLRRVAEALETISESCRRS